jgi:hypothetical protein
VSGDRGDFVFHNKAAIKQLVGVCIGEVICICLMLGVYAIIGRFTVKVLLGAVCGGVLSLLNFLFLSITVSRAADRAEKTGEASKAKLSVQSSSVIRMLVLAVAYIAILKAGLCEPIAAILPLVFVQISITLMEYFRKDGGEQK